MKDRRPTIRHTRHERLSSSGAAGDIPPVTALLIGSLPAWILVGFGIDEAARHLLGLSALEALADGVALGAYVLAVGVLLTLVAAGMRNDERRSGTGADSRLEPARPTPPKPGAGARPEGGAVLAGAWSRRRGPQE